jgi:hypothetical protein
MDNRQLELELLLEQDESNLTQNGKERLQQLKEELEQ